MYDIYICPYYDWSEVPKQVMNVPPEYSITHRSRRDSVNSTNRVFWDSHAK